MKQFIDMIQLDSLQSEPNMQGTKKMAESNASDQQATIKIASTVFLTALSLICIVMALFFIGKFKFTDSHRWVMDETCSFQELVDDIQFWWEIRYLIKESLKHMRAAKH